MIAKPLTRIAPVLALSLAFGAFSVRAEAATIQIQNNSFVFRDYIGLNPFFAGTLDRLVFSTKVNVDGSAPQAPDVPTVTRSSVLTGAIPIPFSPSPAIPNEFAHSVSFDSALASQDWTYRAELGADSTERVVPALPQSVVAQHVNLAKGMTIDGTGTITWEAPTDPSINRATIDILQGSLGNIIAQSRGVLNNPSTTSFNLSDLADPSKFFNPTGFNPQVGDRFLVRIRNEIRDYSRVDQLGNPIGSQESRSSTFFVVTVVPPGSQTVHLPTLDVNGVYNFDLAVQAATPTYVDPEVAIGYDYRIGAGDPLFTSVSLPNVGDGVYDLWLFDASGNPFDTGIALFDSVAFDFTTGLLAFAPQLGFDPSGGIDAFRILGIETSAGLDPADGTAFVTALTFAGSGRFTGTMTPLTTNVPEPASFALLACGIFGLGLGGAGTLRNRRSTTSTRVTFRRPTTRKAA